MPKESKLIRSRRPVPPVFHEQMRENDQLKKEVADLRLKPTSGRPKYMSMAFMRSEKLEMMDSDERASHLQTFETQLH